MNRIKNYLAVVCFVAFMCELAIAEEKGYVGNVRVTWHRVNDQELRLYNRGSLKYLSRVYDDLREDRDGPFTEGGKSDAINLLFGFFVLDGYGFLDFRTKFMDFQLERFTEVLSKNEIEDWFVSFRSGEGLPDGLANVWPEPLRTEDDKEKWEKKFTALFKDPADE